MKARSSFLAAAVLLLASCGGSEKATETAQTEQPAISKGKAIFNANCATCHKLGQRAVGPDLVGAMARWDNDTARISAFIHNSAAAIAKGDPRAKKVFEENHETPMTPMQHLTQADINEVLDYINKGVE